MRGAHIYRRVVFLLLFLQHTVVKRPTYSILLKTHLLMHESFCVRETTQSLHLLPAFRCTRIMPLYGYYSSIVW